jgi:hypothetical protein
VRALDPGGAASGVGNSGGLAGFCAIFGRTIPFSPSQLASLYKNHGQFVSQWVQATHNDVKAGYLLQADAVKLKASAASSQIGKSNRGARRTHSTQGRTDTSSTAPNARSVKPV